MKKIKGSGNIISENRELTNFSSINLIGGIDVNIKFSDKYNCTVVSDENLIPYIKTEVVNNNLQISINKNYSSIEGIEVNVNAPEYDEVSNSGSGDIISAELISKSATITINGSGDAEVFASDSINAKINGAGNIEYFGNPENVDSIINGSGDINSN